VYQAGTLSGNPLATAAGLSVLDHVGAADYDELTARVAAFAKDLESALAAGGLAASVPTVGPLAGLFVAPADAGPLAPPTDYEQAKALAGNGAYARFFHAMLRRGVALAPGPYEILFPGLAHDEVVLARVVGAAESAAAEVASQVGSAEH
jgi:glutamate-1-semialdehyde 2,1-aminomutase